MEHLPLLQPRARRGRTIALTQLRSRDCARPPTLESSEIAVEGLPFIVLWYQLELDVDKHRFERVSSGSRGHAVLERVGMVDIAYLMAN